MTAVLPESGWDHPLTARYYEEFCRRHTRYQEANEALIRAVSIEPGMRILDVGAGTGRTAESALPLLGEGEIECVEPADAMRRLGEQRLSDARVSWRAGLPDATHRYDRIVWGAGIWQAAPLDQTILHLASLLGRDGALCFNIPMLYLGIPDEPGGGPDPLLLELPGRLRTPAQPMPPEYDPLPNSEGLDEMLRDCGLQPERTAFRIRISQECLRDWLKIPMMTDRLMPGVDPMKRARRIDEAYSKVSADSWKWEGWMVCVARRDDSVG